MVHIEIIPLGPLETNCYVLTGSETKKSIIIDPGYKSDILLQYIRTRHLEVTHIVITHGHFDHVGGVTWLLETLSESGDPPIVVMNSAEKIHMENKAVAKYQKYFFDAQMDVHDGQILDFGFIQLKALLLPGHTNYSMCFYSDIERCVFVGDTLFYHSIGTETYYDGPEEDLTKNIEKILFALPGNTVVYPGHKQFTTIDEEISSNPYLSDADTVDPWLI